MATTYQPLPTTDDETFPEIVEPKPKPRNRHRLILFLVAVIVVAFASFKAGQWWSDTSAVRTQPSLPPIPSQPPSPTSLNPPIPLPIDNSKTNVTDTSMHHHGKVSVGYFVNWGIYGRKYPPSLIPVDDLTHLLYAFANLRADTGEVHLSDPWADKDIHYPGDSWNDVGHNLYGNFKAIYNLKKANRHLKILLSIGGWTYSPAFHPIVVSPSLRAKFVETSVKLLEDYGLDGLDIDYEYPSNDEQARGYVLLLKELRAALDRHAHEKGTGYRFLLTIAAPCGPDNYKKLHIKEMDESLDFWNLMAYDFSGSWDKTANHQANLFGPPLSASQSVHHYVSHGVSHSKIVLGIPLYGRSFANTQGPGSAFQGVGGGSWEQGVYDYRALPLPGSHSHRDEKAAASWTYNYETKEMVSYDSEEVAHWKGHWIKQEGLAGSMFWELSGDKGSDRPEMEMGPGKFPQPGKSLVTIVKDAMGGLKKDENWLSYEKSQFENVRKGME